jgi:hypothetical protein
MKNTIKCKNCGAEIEISEAVTHQIEEQVVMALEAKYKKELDEEVNKERERGKKLLKQIDELLDETRKLRQKDEEREIEMKKRLALEEEKIKKESRDKVEEEHKLKDLEKDNMLQGALKQVEELKAKIQQGSQQTQGEALELELEGRLRSEFPSDEIAEVKKGQRGADISQVVIDKLGRRCGTILWESKNAQWSDGWVSKLKEDQRQAKADLAVLVSVNLPEKAEGFIYREGVWICSLKSFVPLALAMRFNLVSVFHARRSSEGKDEKMKVLYNYLTGSEFRNRVEGIVDAFSNLQDELEREKRWFSVKWARQEKEIRKVIDHTHGMVGDLQGVIGSDLPEIKMLSTSEGSIIESE